MSRNYNPKVLAPTYIDVVQWGKVLIHIYWSDYSAKVHRIQLSLGSMQVPYPEKSLPTSNKVWIQSVLDGQINPAQDVDQYCDLDGLSLFQKAVYFQLMAVTFGQTVSYAKLAELMGLQRTSARAVGRAVGLNPFLGLIPCHRVIRSDESLGGYRGGLTLKQYLLEMESKRN